MKLHLTHEITLQVGERKIPVELALNVEDAPGDIRPEDYFQALQAHFGGASPATNGHAEPAANPVHRLVGEGWKPPQDLHGKAMKTVHRILKGVYDATRDGHAATVQEVQERTRISLPPIYNALNPGTPSGKYAAKYVLVGKDGRNKTLDLTPEGSKLVSLMRAGKVPH